MEADSFPLSSSRIFHLVKCLLGWGIIDDDGWQAASEFTVMKKVLGIETVVLASRGHSGTSDQCDERMITDCKAMSFFSQCISCL